MRPVRVLVVDDSAFARKVLREVLGASPAIEVVGIARDGLEGLEQIQELEPDVVTLDLVMPNLDGLGLLKALPAQGGPRVVVVSISDADSELGAEALQSGAIELVRKPTALATERLYELSDELVQKVLLAARARRTRPPEAAPLPPEPLLAPRAKVLVVGTSTGGPQALTRLFAALPADFPLPIVAALHIPAGYTEALSRRLDSGSAISVAEASEGAELRPGHALVARGGSHLTLVRDGERVITSFHGVSREMPFTPSVDVLFESAAEAYGDGVLGVVLTGMGNDGLAGARTIRERGGRVIAESESSCVVYGMPRCVHEAGLSVAQAPLERMAVEIVRQL